MLEFVNGAEGDLLEFLNESLLEETLALPKLLGNIKTGESRAFLSYEKEQDSMSPKFEKLREMRLINSPWYSKAPRIAPITEVRTSADS